MEPCVGSFKRAAMNEFMSVEPKNTAAHRHVGLRNPNSDLIEQPSYVTDAGLRPWNGGLLFLYVGAGSLRGTVR